MRLQKSWAVQSIIYSMDFTHCPTGDVGNLSTKSNEGEVVEAVRVHLKAAEASVQLAQNLYGPDGKILAEADGVIYRPKLTALVKVKSVVRMGSLDQLHQLCRLWPRLEVRGYIGGPLFEEGVKESALRRGFSVVEISGDRYQVVEHQLAGQLEPDQVEETRRMRTRRRRKKMEQ